MKKINKTPKELLNMFSSLDKSTLDFNSENYGKIPGNGSSLGTGKDYLKIIPFDGFGTYDAKKKNPIGEVNTTRIESIKGFYLGIYKDKTNDGKVGYVILAPDGTEVYYFDNEHINDSGIETIYDVQDFIKNKVPGHYGDLKDVPGTRFMLDCDSVNAQEALEKQRKSLASFYRILAKASAYDLNVCAHIPAEVFQECPELEKAIRTQLKKRKEEELAEQESDFEEELVEKIYKSREKRLEEILEKKYNEDLVPDDSYDA